MWMETASAKEACDVSWEIRWAYRQEWEAAMEFVWKAFLESEGTNCKQDGKDRFYSFICGNDLRETYLKGEYPVMLAVEKGTIVGLASVRYHNHLSLLFVDRCYWGKGIGRALLTAMIQYVRDAGERYMSLQAVSGAVNFYRKFGFRAVRPEEEFSGIRITCMEKFF